MQTHLGYPDPSAYDPPLKSDRALAEQRRIERAIAVKNAAADYRARLADERAQAASDLIEAAIGSPQSGDEWAEAPMPLVKLAAVDGSGLDVRGVALLADQCNKRAAWAEPAKYGAKPAQADNEVSIPAADLLRAAVTLATQAGLGQQIQDLMRRSEPVATQSGGNIGGNTAGIASPDAIESDT